MRFRASPEAMALDSPLEAFPFGGTNNINRLASGEQACIELGAKFKPFSGHSLLQWHLVQHLKRAKFRPWTALAVLLDLEEVLNLLIFLLGWSTFRSRPGLCALRPSLRLGFTLRLLVRLPAFGLCLQEWQVMTKVFR